MTETDNSRERSIVNASWVGIVGNAVLSVSKIGIGLLAGSLAVVGDGIDSATDIVTSLITLITAKIISKPPDVTYPYGYEKADTIATKALSFVIFFAGAQLCISTIQQILEGRELKIPAAIAIYVTVISIFGKLALAFHQYRVGKKTNSAMLIANGKNMQNDVLISSGVLAGLFFTFTLKLPVLDKVTALIVSVWIMKTAFGIFMETTTDLMDGLKNPAIYQKIFEVVESVEGASDPHRMRLRKLGTTYMLELDIEVDGQLTVRESHDIAHDAEKKLRREIPNLYDVVIHVEPAGDSTKGEKFGVSKENIGNGTDKTCSF
jgi:cation diffusion facilitator family transporter